MEVNELLTILIGGGGVGAIVAAVMTRQTAKDKNKIDLLDRALQEIVRLEAKLKEAEDELDKEQDVNYELRRKLADLKEQVSVLLSELKALKGDDNNGL